MDFYNFFKSFLGIPNSVPPYDFNDERYRDSTQEGSDNLFRHDGDGEDDEGAWGFGMFGNPAEMQRMFEQQINEMMRAFGTLGEDFFQTPNHPDLEAPQQPGDLREQYLKPGFEAPSAKSDSDIDGKVDINDVDTMLKHNEQGVTPYVRPSQRKPQSSFFGQSISVKTVVKPDGTVETQRTVKDSQGNEETTVSCKSGDKEYTVITRTDKEGKQEREERIIGMDENEAKKLVPVEPNQPINSHNWFDKFFKGRL